MMGDEETGLREWMPLGLLLIGDLRPASVNVAGADEGWVVFTVRGVERAPRALGFLWRHLGVRMGRVEGTGLELALVKTNLEGLAVVKALKSKFFAFLLASAEKNSGLKFSWSTSSKEGSGARRLVGAANWAVTANSQIRITCLCWKLCMMTRFKDFWHTILTILDIAQAPEPSTSKRGKRLPPR